MAKKTEAGKDHSKPLVAVIMGSKSDWDTMRHADETLSDFGIEHECRVISAHRSPVAVSICNCWERSRRSHSYWRRLGFTALSLIQLHNEHARSEFALHSARAEAMCWDWC